MSESRYALLRWSATLCCIGAAAILPASLHAQGLRAGLARTEIIDGGNELDSRNGLLIGATIMSLRFGPAAFVPEVQFVQKGARTISPSGDDAVSDVRVEYVQIDALARVTAPLLLPVRPFVAGGLFLAWEVGCSLGFAGGGDRSRGCPLDGLREAGIDQPFKDADQGYTFGGGVDLSLPRIGIITLEYRRSHSFGRVTQGESATSPKHRVQTFTLGWSGLLSR
jgi:hypothetical protein